LVGSHLDPNRLLKKKPNVGGNCAGLAKWFGKIAHPELFSFKQLGGGKKIPPQFSQWDSPVVPRKERTPPRG